MQSNQLIYETIARLKGVNHTLASVYEDLPKKLQTEAMQIEGLIEANLEIISILDNLLPKKEWS